MKQAKMRFKPGVVELTAGDRAVVEGAQVLRIEGTGGVVRLKVEDIVILQAADLLEPVPEPKTAGQVLYDAALLSDTDQSAWLPWEDCDPETHAFYERTAARVGIKGEG